jgi:hypothetical protein
MMTLSWLARTRAPVLAVLLVASASWAQTCPPAAEKIAKAYGFDSFGQIDAIRYTFNADIPSLKFKVTQRWTWEPKTNRVTYEGKDKDGKPVTVTYVRSQLDSQPAAVKTEIDPAFINGQYNLLFPFHACWDAAADVQDHGMQKLPIGKGTARQVVVKYPAEGGYTPGDTWELFVGPDDRVKELSFRHGGSAPPKLYKTPWADHRKAGPLVVSLDRRGGIADGKPGRIWFTDVAVKLTGSDSWIAAQ